MMTGKGVRGRGDGLRGDFSVALKLPALRLEVHLGGTGPAPEGVGDAQTLTPKAKNIRDASAQGRLRDSGFLVCSRFSPLLLGCWQSLSFLVEIAAIWETV